MKTIDGRTRVLQAALRVVSRRGGVDVTMGEIATAAKFSRQALYLHFADRTALLVALVQYVDERNDLSSHIDRIVGAETGIAALRELVALQVRMNPKIWTIARALDAVRRKDDAAERAWQDRLETRLAGCRAVVERMRRERSLREDLPIDDAAELVWSVTSLRAWEDLVITRGWSAELYETRITDALFHTLVATGARTPIRTVHRSTAVKARVK